MKILVIPDIHGSYEWKEWIKEIFDSVEQIVFLGDYVDDYTIDNNTIDNNQIYNNLKEIIEFKNSNLEKVILLLGNHDLQYLFNHKLHGCSGYRSEAYFDLHDLFNNNKNLFQVAYQINKKRVNGITDYYLFTHAGLSEEWFKNEYQFDPSLEDIAKSLNKSFEMNVSSLFDVGYIRKGYHNIGGIFWADKKEIQSDPLIGIHQIVGHTKVPTVLKFYKDNIENSNTSVTFTDCRNYYILEI